MSKLEGQDSSQGSLVPLHHSHGSPGIAGPFNHGMHLWDSSMEESLRAEDYAAYRLVRPLICDHLPPVAQMSSRSYPEYLLAQPSHYPHVLGQSYGSISSAWPSQEMYHYGMTSGEICHAVASISSEGPEVYSREGYSTHQAFSHHNVFCDVNRAGQVVMLNHPVTGHNNHSVVMNHSTESLAHQSCSTEHCTQQETDSGRTVKIEALEPPKNVNVMFNLKPGPYASQLHQTNFPTYNQTVGQKQKTQTKEKECGVNVEKSKRPCNCTKSQCLKLYCECFANGEACRNCKCVNCFNNTEHETERCQAIRVYLERNPGAFGPKIVSRKRGNVKGCHTKGCNCKRSGCLKNYCECYEANIMCTSTCKCLGCQNYDESPGKRRSARGNPDSRIYCPTRSPLVCITPDVVEATCGCLLVQAEKAEKEGYILPHAEKMILEEFGQCMTQIVQSIFKSTNVQLDL